MCKVLKVTRSGYYAWRKCQETGSRDDSLLKKIKESHLRSRKIYGSPRITKDLQASGVRCYRKKVAAIMRRNGIKARSVKKFRVTTNSRHKHPVALNILDRNFAAGAPDRVWVGDITYLWTHQGWLYLATVIDLYSRKVIGWSMGHLNTADLAVSALKMAIMNRQPSPGLIFHSDQGIQYAGNEFKAALNAHGFIQSMSRKGDCYDNAVAESFFHTLKTELVFFEDFKTRDEARGKVFEYIEAFYNRQRIHSTLGYLSPAQFEAKAATLS